MLFFFDDMINIKNFNLNLLKINKKSQKNTDIYYIWYIKIKNIGDYESIHTVNPLYFIVGKVNGCINKEMGINTQFLLLQIKTKKYQKSIQNFGIKLKDFIKIKFNSDDNFIIEQ